MPRYFYHVHDGTSILDTEGTEFANDDIARAEAFTAAGEMLRDVGRRRFWTGKEWTMAVVDQGGRSVATLSFSGVKG